MRLVPILFALGAASVWCQEAPVSQAASELPSEMDDTGRPPIALEASPTPRDLLPPSLVVPIRQPARTDARSSLREAPWTLCDSALCLTGTPDLVDDAGVIADALADVSNSDQHAQLLAANLDSDVNLDRLIDLHATLSSAIIGMDETWRVLTEPRFVVRRIWVLTRDLALVAAESRIEGAVTLSPSVPLLLILKKDGAQWKIATVRRLAEGALIDRTRLQPIN